MARVDANGWLTKWGNNLSNSSTYITSGVQRVQTAPGVSAAAAADRMLAGVTQAVTSGKWAANVSGVSLQQWQQSMIQKGIPRIQQGVAQAKTNKVAKITQLLQNVDAAVGAVQALPKGGLAQGIARATAFMTAMHNSYTK